MNFIKVDSSSETPKYIQIVDSISKAIQENKLKKGDQIPSLLELCDTFGLSRDTVVRAYREMKSKGIISSRPGKGYYIASTKITTSFRIFLLFDELNAYKKVLYESFKTAMEKYGTVDIFFHHYNPRVFETLIHENRGKYTHYVVMPIPVKSTYPLLDALPANQLYILDREGLTLGQKFPSVYQDFRNDVYSILASIKECIKKYKKLILVFPHASYHPKELQKGFVDFCNNEKITFDIITKTDGRKICKQEAYLVIEDNDLVNLIQEVKRNKLKLGKDIGIISYNDTPLKTVVDNGITTISTDFAAMGNTMADIIINRRNIHTPNPSQLIKRNSL
jgi:DNA-binding transcriptional regulator YhcF (GntR family)